MCEMLGFSSQNKKNINAYLSEFFSHSAANPNGWGIASFDSEKAELYTEPISANDSDVLPKLLKGDKQYKNVIAHIRKATVGGISSENCHPFIRTDSLGREWSLMHNGTVFSGMELIRYQEKQQGDTDSERILLYLIDRLNEEIEHKGYELNPFERFRVVEQVINELSYRNKLNLVMYDGQQMYVHANMKNTLYFKSGENSILFATVPLDNEKWEPMPLTTLFVYQDGLLKYRGRNHHNEFIDTINTAAQMYDYNI